MSDPHCFGSLQVCRLRVAELGTNGVPVEGAATGYVTDAVIKVDVSTEIEKGDELTLKNGCGSVCQSYQDYDRIKRLSVKMDLCQLDSELISMLVGGDLYDTGGDTFGYALPSVNDTPPAGVCMELWTKAWDGTEQATPASTSNNAAYFHWVLPKATFTLGHITMENDIMTIPVEGYSNENTSLPAHGPFNDWPAAITAAGGITSPGGWFLDDAIPDAACGFIAVPTQGS